MRIIGGEWRGRKIEEPRGRDVTRPTTDRVREACASMVMSAFDFDLDEVRVLDAFGGSGALGLEMLSRGARSLTTFEIDRNAARLITKNIESLCRDRARWRVVTGDMLASASRAVDNAYGLFVGIEHFICLAHAVNKDRCARYLVLVAVGDLVGNESNAELFASKHKLRARA